MIPTLAQARNLTAEWNATHLEPLKVAYEHVEEALIAFRNWQLAIMKEQPPEAVRLNLDQHHTFCRFIPDQLLFALFDEEED